MANEIATLEEGRKRWGPGIPLSHESTTVEHISEYIRYKTIEYKTTDLKDSDLWEVFKEDFTGFTVETFKSCIPADIRNLRKLLRKNGVWVIKDRNVLVAQSLFNMLQEEEPTEWTTEAVTAHLADDGGFNSVKLEPIVQEILSPITTTETENHSLASSPAHRAPLQSRPPTPFLQMPPRRPPSTKAPTPIPPKSPTSIPLRGTTPLPLTRQPLLHGLFPLSRDSTPVPQTSRHRDLPLPVLGIPPQNTRAQAGQNYEPRRELWHGPGNRLNQEYNEFRGNSRVNNRFGYGNSENSPGRYPEQRNDLERNTERYGFREEPSGGLEWPEQNFYKGLENLAKLYTEEEKYSGGNDNF